MARAPDTFAGVASLGLDRFQLADLRSRFGPEAFRDYFKRMSAEELRGILVPFDPQTLLLPLIDHADLLERLDWFAEHNKRDSRPRAGSRKGKVA